jgi:hypothetical protein
MFAFGHVLITISTAAAITVITNKQGLRRVSREEKPKVLQSTPSSSQFGEGSLIRKPRFWLSSLGEWADIRILVLGSLLPDVIDKPIGNFFFRETFDNGRIFSHTLVFFLWIAVMGLFLYKRIGKTWLLVLSFGTLIHLVLDQMWLEPRTLLWPFLGFSFERLGEAYSLQNILRRLLEEPTLLIPEIIAGAIIMWFVWLMARKGKLYTLIRHGKI